jgi:magnesium chelatase family protein
MLIAACNTCPCARPRESCTCSPSDIARYARRLSAPLIDRIDLVCQLDAAPQLAAADRVPEGSARVRARVLAARELQKERFAGTGIRTNAAMDPRLTTERVKLDPKARRRLLAGMRDAPITARSHDRVLRIARTIADLDRREDVRIDDVEEALGYKLSAPMVVAAA